MFTKGKLYVQRNGPFLHPVSVLISSLNQSVTKKPWERKGMHKHSKIGEDNNVV